MIKDRSVWETKRNQAGKWLGRNAQTGANPVKRRRGKNSVQRQGSAGERETRRRHLKGERRGGSPFRTPITLTREPYKILIPGPPPPIFLFNQVHRFQASQRIPNDTNALAKVWPQAKVPCTVWNLNFSLRRKGSNGREESVKCHHVLCFKKNASGCCTRMGPGRWEAVETGRLVGALKIGRDEKTKNVFRSSLSCSWFHYRMDRMEKEKVLGSWAYANGTYCCSMVWENFKKERRGEW